MTRRKSAIALAYQPDKHKAPVVIAKGQGLIAEQIIEIAKTHNIPLQDDPQLVSLLAQVELNAPIPESLFIAVAEVLIWIDQVKRQMTTQA